MNSKLQTITVMRQRSAFAKHYNTGQRLSACASGFYWSVWRRRRLLYVWVIGQESREEFGCCRCMSCSAIKRLNGKIAKHCYLLTTLDHSSVKVDPV